MTNSKMNGLTSVDRTPDLIYRFQPHCEKLLKENIMCTKYKENITHVHFSKDRKEQILGMNSVIESTLNATQRIVLSFLVSYLHLIRKIHSEYGYS